MYLLSHVKMIHVQEYLPQCYLSFQRNEIKISIYQKGLNLVQNGLLTCKIMFLCLKK